MLHLVNLNERIIFKGFSYAIFPYTLKIKKYA